MSGNTKEIFHAVSLSGGKDNGKKNIMRSPPKNSRKSLRFGRKLFP